MNGLHASPACPSGQYVLKILALDTSSEYCSVALWRDGDVDDSVTHAGQRHSELLPGMIDGLLRRHGLRVPQLDGIAFGHGPGTFTGLRIGCGLSQGLAFAAGLPVIGIDTLLAMAHATQSERVICCVDARMHEIYHAAYEMTGGGWSTVCAPGVWAPAAAPQVGGDGWLGCGNGFSVYAEQLTQRYAGCVDRVSADVFPHARDIASLAAPLLRKGAGVDAALSAPLYVRDKVALRSDER
jgi:tRNA threonylcarbamoyladenosine biosynthesis protein TsaB